MSETNQNELNFEQKLSENFGADASAVSVNQERLKEINKKLPDWNLEPPMNFIK